MMFPYPSAEGLHVGNMFAFTGADIYGRFQRLQGYDVFEPIGFDAFGIHCENYALKVGHQPGRADPAEHRELPPPAAAARAACSTGATSSRPPIRPTTSGPSGSSSSSSRPGKAYKKKARGQLVPQLTRPCSPTSRSIDGHCERCGTAVEQRFLEQWFFRITDYAERLLANLDDQSKMDWSDSDHARRSATGSAGPRAREIDVRVDRARRADHACSPRGPTRSSAPPSWCWRRSIRWSTRSPRRRAAGRGRGLPQAAAAKDLVSRKVGDKEKTGVFTGGYAGQPGDRPDASRSGSPTTC